DRSLPRQPRSAPRGPGRGRVRRRRLFLEGTSPGPLRRVRIVWRVGVRLEGKVALISGGGRGMGAVGGGWLAREGGGGGRGEVEGRKVEAEIRATGAEALFVRLDVTDEAHWKQAVNTAVERFGKLNVLVNNAGVGSHGRIEDVTIEAWNRVMEINSTGVFLGT